jgi:hypothetical protein
MKPMITESLNQESITEELFGRAGMTPDAFTHLLAAVVLERALNHHHGQRQKDVYSKHPLESSTEVRGHWRASRLLEGALQRAMKHHQRAYGVEEKAMEKAREVRHRRAVAAVDATEKAFTAGAKVGFRGDGEELFMKVGRRESAFRVELA